MRRLILLAFACGPATPAAPPLALALEVTPRDLGAHEPGDLPDVTVAIVNRSTRSYVLPRPGPVALEMAGATLYYEYERTSPDGRWSAPTRVLLVPQDRFPGEDPEATIELAPGARLALDARGIPPLAFDDVVVGKLRARLVYDIDAEWARRNHAAPHVDKLVSDFIELDQLAGPLDVQLEAIGPIVAGKPLDLSHVLRVVVRDRSDHDVTIVGPGEHTGIGFDIERPNGGTWPTGDRPIMTTAPGPGVARVLHPGEHVEVFGPDAELGAMPGTWSYPVAETFRLRADFYQAGQRFHYSPWVTLHAVP